MKHIAAFISLGLILLTTNTVQAQWQQVSNGIKGSSITSLAISGSKYFAGTDGGGLFVADSSNNNWSPVYLGQICTYVKSIISDSSGLFVLGSDGLFLSSDNGDTWSLLLSVSGGNLAVKGDTVVYSSGQNTLCVSFNLGASWSTITPTNMGYCGCIAIAGNNVLVSNGIGVYISNNGCASFYLTTNLTGNTNVTHLCSNNNRVCGVNGENIIVSTDFGLTWTIISGPPTGLITSIAVDETKIVVGTEGCGVYVSYDQGITWINVYMGLGNPFIMCLALHDSTVLAGTNGGGVFLSNDGLNSWMSFSEGIVNVSVHEIRKLGNSLFAGLWSETMKQINAIYRSDDNAQSWQAKVNGIDPNLHFILGRMDKIGDHIFAPVGDQSNIMGTADNGENWYSCNTGLQNQTPVGLITLGSKVFIGFIYGSVYYTLDTANYWLLNYNINLNGISSLVKKGEDTLLIGGNSTIAYTFNQGQSWNQPVINLPSNISCLTIKGDKILAGTHDYGIYISSNWGINWNFISSGMPLTQNTVFCIETFGNLIFAGTNKGVYMGTDYGGSWINITDNLINPYTMSMHIADGYLYVGTSKTGIWRRPIDLLLNLPEITDQPDFQVSPNPFHNQFILDYTGESKTAGYFLYNAVGQLVMQGKCVSSERTTIETGSLKPGIYLLRLIDKNKSRTLKLVKD
ncbi:MAG: T9SS type A sorting domain-containing protein [Bacteroidetes bacterium]|nr:T9SS type A sorting domain-containing protein [Bacteroidota bacterium]